METQPNPNVENQKTDESIARLVQSGDVVAFGELMIRYEAKLKRYGKKFLAGDAGAVEDAVQEAFMKAYRNILSFDASRKFSSWLYRIAHNEFINILKKKKRESLFVNVDVLFPHPAAKEQADQPAHDRMFKENINACLDELSPKYREVLVLYYFEELGYAEIADVLHIPVSTVGIRLKRGKEAVKDYCEKLGDNL